jgi:hypothetical protein
MAESPRRVDLRLTIPAAAPYRALAVELAGKFAEYAVASTAAAADVSKTVEAAVGAAPDGHPAVDLRLSAAGGQVTVTVDASPD